MRLITAVEDAGGQCADFDFYGGKLQAARYVLLRELPGCHQELDLLERCDDTCLAMNEGGRSA